MPRALAVGKSVNPKDPLAWLREVHAKTLVSLEQTNPQLSARIRAAEKRESLKVINANGTGNDIIPGK